MWFSSLREALDGLFFFTQRHVTGQVRLKLYKGNTIVLGRQSPYSLYREDYASFGQMDIYDQRDAQGFISLWGMPLKVDAMLSIAGTGESRFRAPDYSIFKRD
jgi:argininosuccinate synthase